MRPQSESMNIIRYLLVGAGSLLIATSCNKKESDAGGTGLFTLIDPSASNVTFNNLIKETPEEYIYTFNYIYNGGGTAIADFDNDGLQDIYFTGNQVKDKLYKNLGNFKFEDVSAASGIEQYAGWHSGVISADINNDGLMDIYVCRGGFKNTPDNKNLLLINKGGLKFEDQAEKYGVADPGYSVTATFIDYDGDGDLDLYVDNRPERWEIHEDGIQAV